jgi:SAM-dependent methyltransferase
MVSPNIEKMYWGRPLQDNPVGEYRPHEALIEAVASRLMPSGRALVLSNDDGIDALYMAQSGYAVALVGLFPGEVEIARQRIAETDARVQVYSAEPTKMPFHPGEFDVVFDPRVYNALKGEERALFIKELHRITRPGGYIVFVVPSYKSSPPGCMTKEAAVSAFQPPFEVLSVVDIGGLEGEGFLSQYSVTLRRP